MGSSRIKAIVDRLSVAGIIKGEATGSWADFLHKQGFTPGIVSIAVERVIGSGERYIHLGNLTAVCREEQKRLDVDSEIQRSRGEKTGERWKGSKFFQMVKDAMNSEDNIDVRKALIRANSWGRDNSPLSLKGEWDRSDKDHIAAIESITEGSE